MFGAIIGDLVGFPYEYKHEDLTDTSIPLLGGGPCGSGAFSGNAQAGEDFSDKTVLTAALEAGILQFERKLPSIMAGTAVKEDADRKKDLQQAGRASAVNVSVGGRNGQGPNIPQNAFEENYKKELTAALRGFGKAYPLAGYTMDLSIWLFREGSPAKNEDAGPAARVSPVAWAFQDDLYMMRHMARLQAELTNTGKASVDAAEAAACAVTDGIDLAMNRYNTPRKKKKRAPKENAEGTAQEKTEGSAKEALHDKTERSAGEPAQEKTEGSAGEPAQEKTEGSAGNTVQEKADRTL
jgi:ADP-ribosylglycohydrolase